MTKITPPLRGIRRITRASAVGAAASSMSGSELYDHDFAAWLDRQVALLREGKLDDLDVANLAEELEDMSKSKRRELRSRLARLLMHLLKYEFQPEARTNSWRATILEQRQEIGYVLDESPSLRSYLAGLHEDARVYGDAVDGAQLDTGVPAKCFPATNPYGAQALERNFWPGPGPHQEL